MKNVRTIARRVVLAQTNGATRTPVVYYVKDANTGEKLHISNNRSYINKMLRRYNQVMA